MPISIKNDVGELSIVHEAGESDLVIKSKELRTLKQGAILIVPSNYTPVGDEPDTVITDANLPDVITNNSRYVLANPFGISTFINTQMEIYNSSVDKWYEPKGPVYASINGYSYGSSVSYVANDGVIIQTASYRVTTYSRDSTDAGGTTDADDGQLLSAPCRVWCFPQNLTGGNS